MHSSSEAVELDAEVSLGLVSGGSTIVSAGSTIWSSMTRLTRLRRGRGVLFERRADFLVQRRAFFVGSTGLDMWAEAGSGLLCAASLEGEVVGADADAGAGAGAGADADAGGASSVLSCLGFFSRFGVGGDSISGRNTGVTRP